MLRGLKTVMSEKGNLRLGGLRNKRKAEIRHQLMEAALALMEQGEAVTIAAAAKRAGVSAGTAYRHFADSATLLIKAFQELQMFERGGIFADIERELAQFEGVEDRVLHVHRRMFNLILRQERAARLFLAKSLETQLQSGDDTFDLRIARRVKMYGMALEPVRGSFGDKELTDLVHALSAASGLESYIVLKDLCRLGADGIERIIRSNLLAILRTALKSAEA